MGLLSGEIAILMPTSSVLRKESPPWLQTDRVPGTRAAVPLLGKGDTNTQTVCGDGETEAWHANVLHLGLLSLCPRPVGLPAGQGQDRPRDRGAHDIPVPSPWVDGVRPATPPLCSMSLCPSRQ